MRIAVMGAGGAGGYFGGLLARAGNEVTMIARGAHLEALRSHGLQVKSPQGETRFMITFKPEFPISTWLDASNAP